MDFDSILAVGPEGKSKGPEVILGLQTGVLALLLQHSQVAQPLSLCFVLVPPGARLLVHLRIRSPDYGLS
jgi:hypothetical protein